MPSCAPAKPRLFSWPVSDAPLYDVNLQTCPDDWLRGRWRVRRRGTRPATAADAGLAAAEVLELGGAGHLLLLGPDQARQAGTWAVARDPRLGRPYLELRLPGTADAHALVTRLRRSPDGQAAALTLYLQTGEELTLELQVN